MKVKLSNKYVDSLRNSIDPPQIQNPGKYTAQKCRLEANLKVQF